MSSDATADALLAVAACRSADVAAAAGHLAAARRRASAAARRDRQLVEIAASWIAGDRDRAHGLGMVHLCEFPGDHDLVARLAPRGA